MTKNHQYKNKVRNSNIEILRVFFMLVILFHHFFTHGLHVGYIGSDQFPLNFENNINASLALLTHFGVIGFMFISSYYGINLKISKACKLWIQLLFYSLFIFIIYRIIYHTFSTTQIVQSFLPLNNWWFVKYYFIVMLLSPIINSGISSISRQTFLLIVICFGVILYFGRFILRINSFNLDLLLYVYILGRYLRQYPLFWLEKHCCIIFVINSIILFCLPLLLLTFQICKPMQWLWSSYNILVLIEAISCFYTFLHHKPIFRKNINIGASVLAVYLITDHPLVRDFLWSNTYGVTSLYEITDSRLAVIALLLLVFAICIIIDQIREFIMKPIDKVLMDLDKSFNSYH